MKQTKKRGFTIVELVIVIAVVAILAAVLIPTFVNLVNKANQSNDISVVTQFNKVLAADEILNGKPTTMTDVVKVLRGEGMDLDVLKPTSDGYKFAWDAGKNQMLYLNDKNEPFAPPNVTDDFTGDTFVVCGTNEDMVPGYGVYMKPGFTGANTFATSVDTGSNTMDITVNPADDKTYVVRTNGGNLTVNAPQATVHHYGTATVTNVEAVAENSYHEFGTSALIKVAKGRVVIEVTGKVTGVLGNSVTPVTVKVELKINKNLPNVGKNANTTVELIVPEGVTKPEPTEVTTPEQEEQFTNANTMFAGGSGTAEDPYLIETREQLLNVRKNSFYYYYYGSYYGKPGFNQLDGSAAVEFANSQETSYAYYKVADGVKEIDCSNWPRTYLNGVFDGNGVTLKELDNMLFDVVSGEQSEVNRAIIKNVNIDGCVIKAGNVGAAVVSTACSNELIFDNVNINGYVEGKNAASYVAFGPGETTPVQYVFNNCNSTANLVATYGEIAGFIKHSFCDYANSSITLIDSAYTGQMYSSSGACNYVTSNSAATLKTIVKYSPSFAYQNQYTGGDTPTVTEENGYTVYTYAGNAHAFTYTGGAQTITSGKHDITAQAAGSDITVTKAPNAVKAVASLIISPNAAGTETGSYTTVYMTEEITNLGDTFSPTTIKKFDITINGEGANGVTGNTYNVVDAGKGKTHNGATVSVVQYDVNGVVIRTDNFTIAKPTPKV